MQTAHTQTQRAANLQRKDGGVLEGVQSRGAEAAPETTEFVYSCLTECGLKLRLPRRYLPFWQIQAHSICPSHLHLPHPTPTPALCGVEQMLPTVGRRHQ